MDPPAQDPTYRAKFLGAYRRLAFVDISQLVSVQIVRKILVLANLEILQNWGELRAPIEGALAVTRHGL